MNEVSLAKISLVVGVFLLLSVVLPFFVKTIGMLIGLGKDDNFQIGSSIIWTYLLLFIIAIVDISIIYTIDSIDAPQTYKIYERINEFWTCSASNAPNNEVKNIYTLIESIRNSFYMVNALSIGILFFGAGISGYMISGNKNRQQLQNDYISQFITTVVACMLAYMLYYGYGRIGHLATFSPDNFTVLAGNWWKDALLSN